MTGMLIGGDLGFVPCVLAGALMAEAPSTTLSHALEEALRNAWKRQRIWLRTANHLRQKIDRARRIALLLTIATAILAVAAGQGPTSRPPGGKLPAGGRC